jgi:hypothetical protein
MTLCSKRKLQVFANGYFAHDKQVMLVETLASSNWGKQNEFEHLAAFYLHLSVLVPEIFFFLVNSVCSSVSR